MATDPLSELQEDQTLEDTNQSLSQLKLASIDDRTWPADEVPVFPRSGGCLACASRYLSMEMGWRPRGIPCLYQVTGTSCIVAHSNREQAIIWPTGK